MRVSLIQNESVCSPSKTKSMPASSGRTLRPIRPVCRSASVSATSTSTGTLSPAEVVIVKMGSGEASVPMAAGISRPEAPSLWANAEAVVASSIPNISVAIISCLFMKPPLEFLVNRIQAIKY